MTDRPIIYSAPMIQALLREVEEPGTGKTMTRRMPWSWLKFHNGGRKLVQFNEETWNKAMRERDEIRVLKPYGDDRVAFTWTSAPYFDGHAGRPMWMAYPIVQPGDRLYVRERFTAYEIGMAAAKGGYNGSTTHLRYNADGAESKCFASPQGLKLPFDSEDGRSYPSIHMPRWATRLTLIVTGVKIEPLNAITCADAIAEGIRPASNSQTIDCDTPDPRQDFRSLWESLHGAGSWDAREVVAMSFKVYASNIDKMKEAA